MMHDRSAASSSRRCSSRSVRRCRCCWRWCRCVHPVLRRQPGRVRRSTSILHRACRSRSAKPAAAWPTPSSARCMLTGLGVAVRDSDRRPQRRLHVGVRRHAAGVGGPVRRRHAERRAVDRHRRVRLRRRGAAVQAVQRARRRARARHHDDSDHHAHDRGAAAAGAEHDARRGAGARRDARAARSSPSCCRRRCRASSPASCSRWRASPAKRRRCCSPPSTTASSRPTLTPADLVAHRAGVHLRDLARTKTGTARPGPARSCSCRSCCICSLLARFATRGWSGCSVAAEPGKVVAVNPHLTVASRPGHVHAICSVGGSSDGAGN